MGFQNRFARSISLFGLVLTLVASAAPAFADGTETLGTPSIPVGDGSDWGKGFSRKGKWSFSKGKWSLVELRPSGV